MIGKGSIYYRSGSRMSEDEYACFWRKADSAPFRTNIRPVLFGAILIKI